MKYACIRQYEADYPIKLMCRVLRVTRSGYYAWRVRPASQRQQRDNQLRVVIRAIFTENQRRYGSVRIHRELRKRHERVSRKRVARLMAEERLRAKRSRRYRVTSRIERVGPAPHLLQRRFRAPRPNESWVSDVTACPTRHGWLYLAVVLDLFSRRVIGWAAGASPGQELTVPALRMALRRRRPAAGLLHHSDRVRALQRQRLSACDGRPPDHREHEPWWQLLGRLPPSPRLPVSPPPRQNSWTML